MKCKKKAIFLKNSSKPIPRVIRMIKVADDLNYDVLFVGAYRKEDDVESEVWDGINIKRVGRYYPPLNGKKIFTLIFSLFFLNLRMLRELFSEKPELIHASDIETAVPALIYSKIRSVPVIYNIHDNLHERYPINDFFRYFLRIFESFFILLFDVTIVPEEFRKHSYSMKCQSKIKVVKNSPDVSTHERDDLQKSFIDKNKIKILYAGWLDNGRGIDHLLSLSKHNNVEITIAGLGDPQFLEKIKTLNNVVYKGFISHDEILNLTKETDFVYAAYDPVRKINIYAASNKIAESLFFGKPVISNVEMEISKLLKSYDCCVSFNYSDFSQVYNDLCELKSEPESYKKLSNNAISLYYEQYSWEMVEKSIKDVFKMIGN